MTDHKTIAEWGVYTDSDTPKHFSSILPIPKCPMVYAAVSAVPGYEGLIKIGYSSYIQKRIINIGKQERYGFCGVMKRAFICWDKGIVENNKRLEKIFQYYLWDKVTTRVASAEVFELTLDELDNAAEEIVAKYSNIERFIL